MNNAPKDVLVVLHLYQTYLEVCNLINEVMERVATRHEHIKMLKIIADRCIENYPDHNVPTIIIYKNGQMVKTVAKFDKLYRKITVASFEDFLAKEGLIDVEDQTDKEEIAQLKGRLFVPKLTLDFAYGQTKSKAKARKESFDSSEDEGDGRGFTSNKLGFRYV